MFLTSQQQRIAEEMARAKGLICRSCGSASLSADEAEVYLGGEGAVHYKCLKCDEGISLDLTYEEAEHLSLHWIEEEPETGL